MADASISPFGESALLVELSDTATVHALAAALRQRPPAGMRTSVPGLEALLVDFDPLVVAADVLAEDLRARVGELAGAPDEAPSARHRSIPVVYGGQHGPDLEEVARLTGLTPDEVVRRHATSVLTVRICGFAPGFAYLAELPAELEVARLSTPRTRTPAGSVAIAGRMSGIYPADLPGGWRVIGRTPLSLFDPRRDPPTYLAPGDRVAFRPLEASAFASAAGPAADW